VPLVTIASAFAAPVAAARILSWRLHLANQRVKMFYGHSRERLRIGR